MSGAIDRLILCGVERSDAEKMLQALSKWALSGDAYPRLAQACMKGSMDFIEVVALAERAPGFLKKEAISSAKENSLTWDELVGFINYS